MSQEKTVNTGTHKPEKSTGANMGLMCYHLTPTCLGWLRAVC